MVRTDFSRMRCPVARSMAVLGERWSILVLREAYYGTTRFDDFLRHLGIASNILSARLAKLVEHGVLERAPASEKGARHEYRLTEKGRDFFPAYLALKRWGDRWMAGPDGPVITLVEADSGREVTSPPLLDSAGRPLALENMRILPGPGAGRAIRQRFGGNA